MLKLCLVGGAAVVALAVATSASAHNGLDLKEAYAGYSTPMVVSVNHGCKGAPVIGFRLKVPEGITDARAAFDPAWDISYKMRKVDKPFQAHGTTITEVVDEIEWKNPVKVVPADGWYPFRFKMTIPETPNKVLHVRNITVCEGGKTDPYIDMPKEELKVEDPDFAKKAWDFIIATPTPAPFLVIRQAPKKQQPWEWTPEQAKGGNSQEAMAK